MALDHDQAEDHFRRVAKRLVSGRVVPLLGAGVNRCGRPEGVEWHKPEYLPDCGELAEYLAELADFPDRPAPDLVRVSQYYAVMDSVGSLYDGLREILDADYPPTAVHEFFAELPEVRARCEQEKPPGVIVTTNYDDLLERALRARNVAFDLVAYQAVGEYVGSFMHYRDGMEPVPIEVPNAYMELDPEEKLVVLKIHGAIDRQDMDRDSYVITEDDYIEYLAQVDPSEFMPAPVLAYLKRCYFLFLGYSLRDWNLRVILNKIWDSQRVGYNHWAIQLNPADVDERFWMKRGVDIIDRPLEEYIAGLREHLPDRADAPVP
jgi:hypothetical protein